MLHWPDCLCLGLCGGVWCRCASRVRLLPILWHRLHPLTNTISDDVLTAGIMLGELTSARVHLASHLFSFVFQLTHSTPLGVSMVGPIASTPIILSFIFSVVWLMLFTTKASYPAVTTDCSDCTHSVEAGNPHVMSNVPAKRLLPESTGLASAGMASRQKATSFIFFAPSVITTSLSSSLPNPISVGVAPVPYPSLIHGAIGPPSYSAFHAPSLSLSENFPFLHISFCMSPLPLASLALLATYTRRSHPRLLSSSISGCLPVGRYLLPWSTHG